jgi:hypothetical protein
MTRSRDIETGPLAVAAGAVLLLVSLFLDWFEPELSAWITFEALDLVLAALAVAALAGAAGRLGLPPLVGDRALVPLGAIAVVVVASQLVDRPPAALDGGPEVGAWLALLGAVVMLVGGVVSVARISLSVRVGERAPPPPPPASPDTPTAPLPEEEPPA